MAGAQRREAMDFASHRRGRDRAVPRIVMAIAVFCLSQASAAAVEPELSGVLGGQANPLSLQLRMNLGWKRPLRYASPDTPITRDAHLGWGVAEALTPAYSRTELWGQLTPLSILDLRVGAEFAGYFGTFWNLQGFPSYDADFSDDAREASKDQAQAAAGYCVRFSPTLKYAVGRIGFRSTADFEQWHLSKPGPYFYEPYRGALLASGGDLLLSLSTVLVADVTPSRNGRVQVGVMHELLEVFDAPQNRRQRLGPILIWRLSDKRRFGIPEPVLYLGVLPYLQAPNRSGVSMFVGLGFTPHSGRLDRPRP
jgi:hypothetical protein